MRTTTGMNRPTKVSVLFAAAAVVAQPAAILRQRNQMAQRTIRAERGATLVVALIFLLLLTIIGVTAITTSTLQQNMAVNEKDKQASFDAAESALIEAEIAIGSAPQQLPPSSSLPYTLGTALSYGVAGDFSSMLTHGSNWWLTNGGATTNAAVIGTGPLALSAAPKYVVEYVGAAPGGNLVIGIKAPQVIFYRITAWGWGTTPNAVSTLQEVYGRE